MFMFKSALKLGLIVLMLATVFFSAGAAQAAQSLPNANCAQYNLTPADVDAKIAEINGNRTKPIYWPNGTLTIPPHYHYCDALVLSEEYKQMSAETEAYKNRQGFFRALGILVLIGVPVIASYIRRWKKD
jgi:hypothetical protein